MLTPAQADTLAQLHADAQGQAAYPVTIPRRAVHHKTLKALARRDLITLESPKADPDTWHIVTLTAQGVKLAGGLLDYLPLVQSTSDERNRKPVRFNLDTVKPDQRRAYAYTERLKADRQLTPTVTAALRLYESLQSGDVSLLLEQFAHLTPAIADVICDVPAASVEFQAELNRIAHMADTIEYIRRRVDETGQQPVSVPAERSGGRLESADLEAVDSNVSDDNILDNILGNF